MSYGTHVSKTSCILFDENKKRKNMIDSIKKDVEIMDLKCIQIFVQGPRSSKMTNINYDLVNEYCKKNKINVYVHSSYITVGIFSIGYNNKENEKSKKTISSLISQFEACDKINSKGLVIHLSKKNPNEIIDTLSIIIPLIKKFKTPIIFEQPAKKPDGDKTYETSEKINKLTKLIIDKFPNYNNWYWCFDTCHIWSAGINLSDKKITKNWLDDLLYPQKIRLVHLNGASKDIYNTGKDKHIVPFSNDDDIWSNIFKNTIKKKCNSNKKCNDSKYIEKKYLPSKYKNSSLYYIIEFCKKYKIDSILEINRGESNEINFAFEIMKKIY